jgi:hypothetical protein
MDFDLSDEHDDDDDFVEEESDDSAYGDENYIVKTYVCEECDFRWTEKIFPERNDFPDYEDELGGVHSCPMCGSQNVSFY